MYRPQRLRAQRRQRLRRIGTGCSLTVIVLIASLVIFGVKLASGQAGAALADRVRAVAGPAVAARVEEDYLLVRDDVQRLRYKLGFAHPAAPWNLPTPESTPIRIVAAPVGHTIRAPQTTLRPPSVPSAVMVGPTLTPSTSVAPATSSAKSTPVPAPTPKPVTPTPTPDPPSPIAPLVSPALPGEGQWVTVTPGSKPSQPPMVSKTFWRPDTVRPYAIVTVLAFDLHQVSLNTVAGTQQPGGPLGHPGPGVIPKPDRQPGTLLAAFNGGFKLANGQFGMMVDGHVYVPPKNGVGTLALMRDGQVLIGVWGQDPALSSTNTNLIAYRQNGPLLIDRGSIQPLTLNSAAWGQTVGGAYTWRSGIGLDAHGRLLYAAGNSLTASTLAAALRAAGAVRALELDINPFWVRAFTYSTASNGSLAITKLQHGMHGTGWEYLSGTTRDFFYVTQRHP